MTALLTLCGHSNLYRVFIFPLAIPVLTEKISDALSLSGKTFKEMEGLITGLVGAREASLTKSNAPAVIEVICIVLYCMWKNSHFVLCRFLFWAALQIIGDDFQLFPLQAVN